MQAFQLTAHVARPPREVFAVVADPRQAVHVVEGVTGTTKVTAGPIGVGTTFRETRAVDGAETTADLHITGYEPDTRVAVSAAAEGITITYRYDLEPDGVGTRLHWTCELDADESQQDMLPMVAEYLLQADGDHLQRLKRHLETPRQATA